MNDLFLQQEIADSRFNEDESKAPGPLDDNPGPYVGQPIINLYDKSGCISRVIKNENQSMMMIGAGGLKSINFKIDIEYKDGTQSRELSEQIVKPWIEKARRMDRPSITTEEVKALADFNEAGREAARKIQDQERDAHTRAVLAWEDENRAKVPTWAKAAIVADLVEDNSDIMSDYHGSTTKESIILGFSKHTRDLFPEMRKAARNAPETEFLADAPADAEHREKYSMGGGYYLKDSYRHNSGWKISKRDFYNTDGIKNLPSLARFSLAPERKTTAPQAGTISAGNYTIESRYHSKRNFNFWICVPVDRMERADFNSERDRCKEQGGWYCRAWAGDDGGFAFTDEIDARGFASIPTDPGPGNERSDTPPETGAPVVAEKLRTMADKLSADIESKRADRLTNTPKRQAQANSARTESDRLERVQRVMYALAAMHEAGKVPAILLPYKTKKAIYEAMSSKTEQVQNGYHAYYIETGEPRGTEPGTLALWETLKESAEIFPKEDRELQRKIEALQFSKIPGYFPTPGPVIDLMLDHAGIDSEMSVLEPSAGSGAIMDRLKELDPTLKLYGYEVNYTLAEILETKGHHVSRIDFLSVSVNSRYDRIIMNPPFTRGCDIRHTRHALQMLRPGGSLVGFCYGGSKQEQALRPIADHWQPLGAGAFSESGTGAGAVLFRIVKD